MAEEKELRPISEMSYKEASVELEQIVRELESGDLELEESLQSYDRGVALLRDLRERLANAEQKVQELSESAADNDSEDEEDYEEE